MMELYEASEEVLQSAANSVPELDDSIKEWVRLKRELTALGMKIDQIKKQADSLEKLVIPQLQELAVQEVTVDDAIVRLASRQVTSVQYKAAFDEALKKVNAQTAAILEQFKEEKTTSYVKPELKMKEMPRLESKAIDALQSLFFKLSGMIKRNGQLVDLLTKLSYSTQLESFVVDEVLAGQQVEEALDWLR